jgi:hypothetical protein
LKPLFIERISPHRELGFFLVPDQSADLALIWKSRRKASLHFSLIFIFEDGFERSESPCSGSS